MLTPLHSSQSYSSQPSPDSQSNDPTTNMALTLQFHERSVFVTHDGFSIGSSPRCSLMVAEPGVAPLHSVIHWQCGAVWIQAGDDATLLVVNDQPCRRMSLRHQDRFRIGATEFTFLTVTESAMAIDETVTAIDKIVITEDLGLLTAEELCDRILSEQTMVAQFEKGQRLGWDALHRAIEEANDETLAQQSASLTDEQQVAFQALMGQIHDLNETISERTRELTSHEAEILSSTSMLDETQRRVSQRIVEILDQLDKTDPPNELRASA